ncbi:hypothetical protein VTK56DRAFT_5047 [Thermocarpiscus australiensis]
MVTQHMGNVRIVYMHLQIRHGERLMDNLLTPRHPPNLKYEIDDAALDWTYPHNHFDYIHMRYLFGSISDRPRFLRQAYRCCKPGGYIESFEPSCVFKSDDGILLEGSPMDDTVQDAFREAGFVNITEWEFKCPIGGWPQDKKPKEIGMYAHAGIVQDIEGWILFVWAQVMGWTKEEIQVYIAYLRKQLRDPRVQSYVLMRCVYGQKPADEQHPAAATT